MEALAQAGGPSQIAMLDDVSILSVSDGNPSWVHVNFESFLTGEDATANPDALPGDTVFVPGKPEEERPFNVNVVGQVAKQGVHSVPAIPGSWTPFTRLEASRTRRASTSHLPEPDPGYWAAAPGVHEPSGNENQHGVARMPPCVHPTHRQPL